MNRHILEKLKSEGSVKDDSIVVPFKSIKPHLWNTISLKKLGNNVARRRVDP